MCVPIKFEGTGFNTLDVKVQLDEDMKPFEFGKGFNTLDVKVQHRVKCRTTPLKSVSIH